MGAARSTWPARRLAGRRLALLAPFSTDAFGRGLKARALADGVRPLARTASRPTSLAVVTVVAGQPSYGLPRGHVDRDYGPDALLDLLQRLPPGVLHTGSLMLVPPEHVKVLQVLAGARALGWTISLDVNLRQAVADDAATYRHAVLESAGARRLGQGERRGPARSRLRRRLARRCPGVLGALRPARHRRVVADLRRQRRVPVGRRRVGRRVAARDRGRRHRRRR